jgi:hypothetical protein
LLQSVVPTVGCSQYPCSFAYAAACEHVAQRLLPPELNE